MLELLGGLFIRLVETDMGTPLAELTGLRPISVVESVKEYTQQVSLSSG